MSDVWGTSRCDGLRIWSQGLCPARPIVRNAVPFCTGNASLRGVRKIFHSQISKAQKVIAAGIPYTLRVHGLVIAEQGYGKSPVFGPMIADALAKATEATKGGLIHSNRGIGDSEWGWERKLCEAEGYK